MFSTDNTLAGLTKSLELVGKKIGDIRIVINGAGAAGAAIAGLLAVAGAKEIIVCDSKGAIFAGRTEHMNRVKDHLANTTNPVSYTHLTLPTILLV